MGVPAEDLTEIEMADVLKLIGRHRWMTFADYAATGRHAGRWTSMILPCVGLRYGSRTASWH
jgi:hypothetical protein